MTSISTLGQRVGLAEIAVRRAVRERMLDDRGEGVISMAIAVLIIAAVGGILWGIFQVVANNIGNQVDSSISNIGPSTGP